jgi:hypothetical protein
MPLPCGLDDPRQFCADGVSGARMLAQDILDSFNRLEQQTKFYLLWGGCILVTMLFVMELGTLLLLCLGLAIGGTAQVLLARRFPELYGPSDPAAWDADAEMQAVNPAAAGGGGGGGGGGAGGGGGGADVASQLRALETMGASRVLSPEQVQLAKQQVLTSSGLGHAAAGYGGGGAGGGAQAGSPAPLPRSSSMSDRISSGQSTPRVDTTDVGIEVATAPAGAGGGGIRTYVAPAPQQQQQQPQQRADQSWHAQGMA